MRHYFLGFCLFTAIGAQAQVHPVEPVHGAGLPNSVRSSGVDAGDYLYISGQCGDRPDGTLGTSFPELAGQALENVKSVVVEAGLTMEHVVYVQIYLTDISNYTALHEVMKKYFPGIAPAGAVLGVSKLPRGSIQINAVALRDLSARKAVLPPSSNSDKLFSPGILTQDRLFVSAMQGRDPTTGKIPRDPAAQTDLALDGLNAVVEAAGLTMKHFVFVNPYLTRNIPTKIMNERYAGRFEFGNTPARATILVSSLPENAQIEYTGVAVRDLQLRRSIRPKNMAPSPTASPCVFAGETLYCSAKSGFIPGLNGGVYATTTASQLRQTMRNQLDNLEEANMSFDEVVSTTAYLDNLSDTEDFNKVYREYFKSVVPAQTILQQLPPADRAPDPGGHVADLEQMSLIAVRRHANK